MQALLFFFSLLFAAGLARPWLAPGQPIAARVDALMQQMTDDEMASQLLYDCANNIFDGYNSTGWGAHSIGAMGIECSGYPGGSNMSARIGALRAFQQQNIAYSRLGIPISFVIETSHCGAAGGTIFPMGATQGATWNASLVREVAAAIALEARAWGGDRGLSPEISLSTDPRFGRTEENFGEEPLHGSVLAAAAVAGLQGGNEMPTDYLAAFDTSIVAEAKHCCAYGFSGLDGGAADLSEKSLHDVYLRPWRAFIRAGGRGMMASHNDLNGRPMHAGGYTARGGVFQNLFRGSWNYTGFVHSDWGNIGFLTNTRMASNATGAAALAMRGGVDQAFCDGAYSPGVLAPALASGAIPRADFQRAVRNVLTAKFAAGLFDGALPDPARRPLIYTAANKALARRVAAEGAVLLRNRGGALPLKVGALKSVAVIGPNAGCAPAAGGGGGGGCTTTPGIDCDGNDISKIAGVTTGAACCALCANFSGCAIAVLATDANQCLLKTACSGRTPNPARLLCDPGKPQPPPTPWTCRAMRGMLGGYSNLERNEDAEADNHAQVVTVLEAVQGAGAAAGFNVSYAEGVAQAGFDAGGIPAAVAAAAAADVAILVLGDGGESVGYDSSVSCGEGADRPSLDLPGLQLALLAQVLDTGKPTIVVVAHGRPFTFGSNYGGAAVSSVDSKGALDARAGAVLAAWRPGCEGGQAIWDILSGAVSPSGRLAQSWPISVGGVRVPGISPAYIKLTDQGGAGWTLGQPFAPAFPLGYGLDYLQVTFGASSVAVDAAARAVTVTVQLNNAAAVAGGYVVQVYFSQALARYSRFQSMLGGWTKAWVPAVGGVSVDVDVTFEAMAYYDPEAQDMVLDGGDYELTVCANIAACDKKDAHTVTLPETHGL